MAMSAQPIVVSALMQPSASPMSTRVRRTHCRATASIVEHKFYGPSSPILRRNNAVITITCRNSVREARKENVVGEFFVDHTCIDCDTCRWMSTRTFERRGDMSAVVLQPETEDQRLEALQALLACPTASIHTRHPPSDILSAHQSFPLPVLPSSPSSPSKVFHCGYHSKKSFGATSYFLQDPLHGNILVDSPRFTECLAQKLDEMGGVRFMFLTHRDDVADHKKWAERMGCQRVIHASEVTHDTAAVEVKLEGRGPWIFPRDRTARAPPTLLPDHSKEHEDSDVVLLHTPGHTDGCVSLFVRSQRALFTGDHLAKVESGQLSIFRRYSRGPLEEHLESVEKLLPLDFVWILPGHGRRCEFENKAEKDDALRHLVSSYTNGMRR